MADHLQALEAGFRLGDYEVESVVSSDPNGIKYLCSRPGQDDSVAIREYLPTAFATRDGNGEVVPASDRFRTTFDDLLQRFLGEGRAATRFRHGSFVTVHEVFEANGTGYVVLDYVRGETLSRLLAGQRALPGDVLQGIATPLLDGLAALHASGLLHLDLRPGNVVIADGAPVVLALGYAPKAAAVARQSLHDRRKTYRRTFELTPYAPLETYSDTGHVGPWTDTYALGATLYHCVTGEPPPPVTDRMVEDRLGPASGRAGAGLPTPLLATIDAALALRPAERPSIAAWRRTLRSDSDDAVRAQGPRRQAGGARAVARASFGRPSEGRGAAEGTQSRFGRLLPVAALSLAVALISYVDVYVLRSTPEPASGTRMADTGNDAPPQTVDGASEELLAAAPSDAGPALPLEETRQDSAAPEVGDASPDPDVADTAERPEVPDVRLTPRTAAADTLAPVPPDVAAADVPPGDPDPLPDPPGPDPEIPDAQAPTPATLFVETTPPGATVWLAGAPVGETPLERHEAPAGVHDVLLRHPHYQDIDLPGQRFLAGAELRLERTLTRARGDMHVTTEPAGAWIDGPDGRLAETTPATLHDLPAGPITLTLGADGHRAEQVSAVVPKGALGELSHVLSVVYGTLTVLPEPADAAVTVTTAGGLPYAPGMRLREGDHRVEVSRDGYRPATRTVVVAGETALRVALEPQPPPCELRRRDTSGSDVYRAGQRLRRYGTADIHVAFTVDEGGEVEADSMAVDREASAVSRPRYFDLFEVAAREAVAGYSFVTDSAEQGTCTMRQRTAVLVRFRFR